MKTIQYDILVCKDDSLSLPCTVCDTLQQASEFIGCSIRTLYNTMHLYGQMKANGYVVELVERETHKDIIYDYICNNIDTENDLRIKGYLHDLMCELYERKYYGDETTTELLQELYIEVVTELYQDGWEW